MNDNKTKRIASLIASATEIVYGLGCEAWLVGRSHECDYPPTVSALSMLTEPNIILSGTSADIDRRIKDIIADGLSVYRVDKKALEVCSPDIILTQDQCDVCAVSLRDVEAALCDWVGHKVEIISLKPDGLPEVFRDIKKVAKALGVEARGDALVSDMNARMARIEAALSEHDERPSIACIEWIDPLMAAGNWMPELVEKSGGTSVFGESGRHSPWMSWDQLKEADPDVIAIMPCGFSIPRSRQEMPILAGKSGWSDLKAVRRQRVFLTDGNQYFNRPGPRLVESLEILAELLHPDLFDYGHHGTGWVHFFAAN